MGYTFQTITNQLEFRLMAKLGHHPSLVNSLDIIPQLPLSP